MITKKLKYATFNWREDNQYLYITGVDGGYTHLPRNYMISLMRFGLRILQKPKPRKKR